MTKPIPVSLEGFSGEVAGRFEIRSLRPGLQLCRARRRAISHQRQQRRQRAGPGDGRCRQEHDALAQLHRRVVAAAGARVRRRHRAGHHRQKRHRADQNRLQGASSPTATAKFTWPISTATTRRPSRTTTPSLPRPRGCRAGWRFITPPTSSATRTFFTTTSPPASAASSRGYSGLNTSAAVSPDGSKVAMILSKSGSPNVWVCNADGTDLKQLTTTQRGFVAVLVAGRAMDLFRDQNQRAPRAGQSAGGRRRGAAHSDRRRAEPDRTRLVAGRQMDRVHVADGRV